jgi:L-2-hydroxyglutarate oxidase LhgO
MDFDFIVIGAGSVGLAATELLSRKKFKILNIEKENRIGTGVSSRNSEVIHAGIYYPKGSLKSRLCLRGKELLYEWCKTNGVAHQNIGKYIIAANEEEQAKLESIRCTAKDAGLSELYTVSSSEINKIEPEIFSTGGLYSPTTGIISAHGYMDSLKAKAEQSGADFLFESKVKNISKNSDGTGYKVEISQLQRTGVDFGEDVSEIEVGGIINCAGLYADEVSKVLKVYSDSYAQKFVKGNYFRLRAGKGLFHHLIYPVPMSKLYGLGVHITLDLEGGVRFGPDTESMQDRKEEYSVDESRRELFYKAVKKYFKNVKFEDLMPDMAGIRPRLAADNDFNDFIIRDESDKNMPGIITCAGMESPGLTASLAIAEYIAALI